MKQPLSFRKIPLKVIFSKTCQSKTDSKKNQYQSLDLPIIQQANGFFLKAWKIRPHWYIPAVRHTTDEKPSDGEAILVEIFGRSSEKTHCAEMKRLTASRNSLLSNVLCSYTLNLLTAYASCSLFPNSSLGTHIRKALLCSQL